MMANCAQYYKKCCQCNSKCQALSSSSSPILIQPLANSTRIDSTNGNQIIFNAINNVNINVFNYVDAKPRRRSDFPYSNYKRDTNNNNNNNKNNNNNNITNANNKHYNCFNNKNNKLAAINGPNSGILVHGILQNLGLNKHAMKFRQVSYKKFLTLKEIDLNAMGITRQQEIRKILGAVKKLQNCN